MSPGQRDRFVDRVLEWYDSHGRHGLPWRASDATPFEVFVAELMLQQTSVEQVLGVYPDFLEGYSTPAAIVDTAEADLAEEIHPLGLSKRVEYFVSACEQIVDDHSGRVPTDPSDLLELHGVGEYTARSVLTHAHGEDAPAVHTNVERVLSRSFETELGDEPSTDDIRRTSGTARARGIE